MLCPSPPALFSFLPPSDPLKWKRRRALTFRFLSRSHICRVTVTLGLIRLCVGDCCCSLFNCFFYYLQRVRAVAATQVFLFWGGVGGPAGPYPTMNRPPPKPIPNRHTHAHTETDFFPQMRADFPHTHDFLALKLEHVAFPPSVLSWEQRRACV